MVLRSKRVLGAGVAALCLVTSLLGCEDEKKTAPVVDAGAQDASAGPVLGGRLGAAVAAAANAPPEQNAKPDAGAGGPPENGIFEPGAADVALAPNAPPKIELFGEGSDPKMPLTYSFKEGVERKASVLLQVKASQGQGLPFIVELVFKSDKPKDEKKKDDKKEEAAPAAAPAGKPVVVKIAKIKPLRGDLPKELEKFTDTIVRYRLTDAGVATDVAIEYPKETNPGVELVATSLIDAILAMTTPLPEKPVGLGAYWMVTDRARSSGVDVVRYRVAKIEKIDGKTATVSIELRQYATNTKLGLAALPKDADVSLDRYESQGKGQLDIGGLPFLPAHGQIQVAMQSLLKSGQQMPGQQPGQRLMIQTDTRAALDTQP